MPDDCRTQTGAGEHELREQLIREIDEARARLAALEKQLAKVPSIDLKRVEVDPGFIEIIPAEIARKHRVLPLGMSRVFTIAMADPSDQLAIEEISARTGYVVQPVLADHDALDQALDHYYGPPGSTGGTARAVARANLRLVWSRPGSTPEQPHEGPGGGRSVA